jgi:glutathione S-transferase
MHAGQVRRASAMDCRGEVRAGLSVDGAGACRPVLSFVSDKACNPCSASPVQHNALFVFMGTTMITVHHLNDSRSQRVLWLLEELDLPYEIKHYQRDPKTMLAPAELRQVHPLGKSPVITDGGVTVAESGAIIDYLVERYGQGRFAPAAGTPEHLKYRYWLHFAEGSAMPPLLMKLVFERIKQTKMPFFIKPIARGIADKVLGALVEPNLRRHLDFMEAELAGSEWFAGSEFSAADIQMSFPLEASRQRAGLDASRPKLVAWLDRIHARPAYQRALQRGGPYSFA